MSKVWNENYLKNMNKLIFQNILIALEELCEDTELEEFEFEFEEIINFLLEYNYDYDLKDIITDNIKIFHKKNKTLNGIKFNKEFILQCCDNILMIIQN